MSKSSGLAPMLIIILGGIFAAVVVAGGLAYKMQPKPTPKVPNHTVTPKAAKPKPSPSPTPIPSSQKYIPAASPIQNPNLGTITNHVEDFVTKNVIPTGDFIIRIDNKETGERFEQKGPPKDFTKSNLKPGPYRVSVYFPDPFVLKSGHCDGCVPTWGNLEESRMHAYEYDLKAGQNLRFTTVLEAHDSKYYEQLAAQNSNTSSNSGGDDKEPPKSNLFYPQNGGTMTYKYSDKYCVVMMAPSDNKDSWDKLEYQYRFDDQSWSSWIKGEATFCTDFLTNNTQHTYEYHYKDSSGNEEAVKKITFTVAIP